MIQFLAANEEYYQSLWIHGHLGVHSYSKRRECAQRLEEISGLNIWSVNALLIKYKWSYWSGSDIDKDSLNQDNQLIKLLSFKNAIELDNQQNNLTL